MNNVAHIEKERPIDKALVKRTVANGATDDELELYLYDCKRQGVHPLDKLLHFTKRGNRYTPVTSIDLMRSRAAATGELAGSDDAVFVIDDNGKPFSATVTVYRLTQGQRFAYTATARWSEYQAGGPMWQKMPHTMLSKCSEALALRKGFPIELSGLYAAEEMDQVAPDVPREAPKITPAKAMAAPVQINPQTIPHDPQTGEVLEPEPLHTTAPAGPMTTVGDQQRVAAHAAMIPHALPWTPTTDWGEWREDYLNALRGCTTLTETDGWIRENTNGVSQMAAQYPKMYSALQKWISKWRAQLATSADMGT